MSEHISLKWLDGNDIISSGNVSSSIYDQVVTPTFNVDNPTMWPPLSVLSGLASGYCERRAVLNDVFVVGTTTTSSGGSSVTEPVELYWYTDADTRAAITSYCMNNMAMGSSIDSLYNSSTSPVMYPLGSAAVSNYMTTMDAAITDLIGSTTANKFVSSGTSGVYAAYQFDTLAAAASATATATALSSATPNSAIEKPQSNGGSSLCGAFLPALPVEWAKERKWMLDQLRHGPKTAESIDAVEVYALDTFPNNGGWIYSSANSGSTISNFISNGMTILTSMSVSGGTADDHLVYKELSTSTYSGTVIQPVATVSTYRITSLYADQENGKAVAAAFDVWGPSNSKTGVQLPPYLQPGEEPHGFCYGMDAVVSQGEVVSQGVIGDYNTAVYFGAPCVLSGTINAHLSDDRAACIVTSNIGSTATPASTILVKAGGSIEITGGTVRYLCISSGGIALVGPAAEIESCNVMQGGTLSSTDSTMKLGVLKADYRHLLGNEDSTGESASIYTETFNVVSAASQINVVGSDNYYMVTNGARAVFSASSGDPQIHLIVMSGAVASITVDPDATMTFSSSCVLSGGTLHIVDDRAEFPDMCFVAPAGSLRVSKIGGRTNDNNIMVYSGGYLSFAPAASSGSGIYSLCIESGAVISGLLNVAVDQAHMYMYTNFGMTTSAGAIVTQGWNSIKTTLNSVGAGGSASAVGTLIGWPTASAAPDSAKAAIVGATYSNPYDPSLGYDKLSAITSLTISAGIRPLAVNGGPPGFGDYYSTFRVRQFPTDEEVSSTFPSA